ncbi:MAG: peptide deformylase [Ignavibacteriaceae bacterium]
MKKYSLKIYPDLVLREVASPVKHVSGQTCRLIKRMSKIMYSYKGIGLAAPQVGISERVIIADTGDRLITMINPEILTGFGEDYLKEGCLSVPETFVTIKRIQSIVVRYINKNENEQECELKGITARIIQHEIDHLNGVLIIDHTPLTEISNLKVNEPKGKNENCF